LHYASSQSLSFFNLSTNNSHQIYYNTLQPIQLAKLVLQELSAHWTTYAKLVLSERGQKMLRLDAALMDNMKVSTHSAKTAQQESI
jgi:hypothetical protein